MTILAELRDDSVRRSKSARKIASFILQDPHAVLGMPIAAVAGAVGVSEPTVNRFCTGLGMKGFPDFKLRLAAELGRASPRIAEDIEPGDSTSQMASKVFESTQAGLAAIHQQLDIGALDAVIDKLANARSILLCGLGASASVALDAQHKLLRFGSPVTAHTDIINQRVAASTLNEHDAVLCISYTGRTQAMLEVAAIAHQSGAKVIGITAPDSPLAAQCDLLLAVEPRENTDAFTPMSSRIGQLVLIDVIASGLALRLGPEFASTLKRIKDNLAATRRA
jgi:RpiR family transcriptional regulator, carbohydrate utilization regulator